MSNIIGTILGNYRILKMIGEGGMGAVYLARDLSLEREVALKIISPELARKHRLMERFRVEAIAQAKLNHSHIVTIHSFDKEKETYFIVMEYVQGDTLKELIKASGKLPLVKALKIFSQVLEGIGYAHSRGVVHRDIKPSNVYLTQHHTAKIGDFGIAKVEGIDGLTKIGTAMGSPTYSSPEQLLGKPVDSRSDIYSLGITLNEMITGDLPFEITGTSYYESIKKTIETDPRPPSSLNPAIPPAVDQLILKSIAREPDDRFQTVVEFHQAVQGLLCELSPVTPPPSSGMTPVNEAVIPPAPTVKTPPPPKKPRVAPNRTLLITALTLAAVLIIMVLFLVLSTSTPPAPHTVSGPDRATPSTTHVFQPAHQMPRIDAPTPSEQPPATTPPPDMTTTSPSSSITSSVHTSGIIGRMNQLIARGMYKRAAYLGIKESKRVGESGLLYQKIAQAFYYDGEKKLARNYCARALKIANELVFHLYYKYKKSISIDGTLHISRGLLSFVPQKPEQNNFAFKIAISQIKQTYQDYASELTDLFKKRKNRKNPAVIIRASRKRKYFLVLPIDDGKLRGFIESIIDTLRKNA